MPSPRTSRSSRPSRILLALAVALALAVGPAACGGGSSGSGGEPQQILDEATLEGIESGNVDLSVAVDAKGGEGGRVDVAVSGPFEAEEGAEFPKLDLTASAKGKIEGETVDFEGGLTLLGGIEAYVAYDGVDYEVDATTFGYVRGIVRPGESGQSNEVTACQEAVGKLQVGEFVENPRGEGTADVGGTETTKVGGDIDTSAAVDALIELSEDPACKEQLDAVSGSLPSKAELEKAKREVKDAVKSAHVELYVGDDHIVRRLTAQATIEPRASVGKGVKSVDLDVDLTLTGVNEEQTMTAPTRTQPLTNLFIKLDITPFELLELLEGKGGLGRGGINGLLEEIGGLGEK
jgi:hypothetical protein